MQPEPSAPASSPLILADSGRTQYRIVIADDADYGETLAAKELAHFLLRMTGVEFPVGRDKSPVSDFEIVLGSTNRKSLEDIPKDLRTDNWEGFTILREDAKLYIMGNIPRGTLYGVYDFLDVELGVRFLTAEVTHVPVKRVLEVPLRSRTYGPVIEQRAIWLGLGGQSMAVRNRMNALAFTVANSKLGGVKTIGPKVHSFSSLVPVDKYFDDHPEYFSEIEGERRREHKGLWTQLCMSNPEVAEAALETIRGWLSSAVKDNSYNKYLVNVTVNDSTHNFCKCVECVAINKEEGVVEGGTMVRFVNTIASQLGKEFPSVAVEAMHYGTSIPKKTKFVSNVLMRIVIAPDWRMPLDDTSNDQNRDVLATVKQAKEAIGDGSLYVWAFAFSYGAHSYLNPRPNLTAITDAFRVMAENGVRGVFTQTSQSRGTEMQDLRYYLIARAMWRPELDNRMEMEEFCRLYYGKAAEGVLRYIDFLHDTYGSKNWSDPPMANTTLPFDDDYLENADRILARAEARAETPEKKMRVATCRLPIWKIKLDRAFGEVGKVFSFPVQWSFKMDPQDVGLKEEWQKTGSFDGWQTMNIDKHWTAQGEDRRGVGWYGIDFEMPDTGHAPLGLWLGAVDGVADIFIDGEKIGEQKLHSSSMWCQGFFVPLPQGLLSRGTHRIVVRVFKENFGAGIWKNISIVDMSEPISNDLRTAGERFIEVGRWAKLSHLTESYGAAYTQTTKAYYPKVEFFLTHGRR